MKKIMMALVGAFMVANAHGAFVQWETERNWNSAANSSTIYMFLASDASTVNGWLSSASDAAAFASAVTSQTATPYSSATANGKGAASGSIQVASVSTAGTEVPLFAVIVSGDNYYTTGNVTGTTSTAEVSGTNASFTDTTVVSTAKTFGGGGDVPEPTSGLLLLVGGAMLALRRKQK